MTAEPLGNGEIAEIIEGFIVRTGHVLPAWQLEQARQAVRQLRSDRRALRAKARLEGCQRNLPADQLSRDERAVNDAYIILNWDVVPEWLDEYSASV